MSGKRPVSRPSRRTLGVYLARPVAVDQQTELIAILSPAQKNRIMSKRNVFDQEVLLMSQYLQRYVGSRVSELDWRKVYIERDEKQKPYFTNIELKNVPYSVSYDNQTVGMVCGHGGDPVGLDIVDVSIYTSWDEQYLTPMEPVFHGDNWAEIKNPSEGFSLRKFLMFWTLQEAYYKLLGVGVPGMDGLSSSQYVPWIEQPQETNINTEAVQTKDSGGYQQIKQALLEVDGKPYFGTVLSKDDIIMAIVCVRPFDWNIEQITI